MTETPLIVVNGDDFGMTKSATRGVIRAYLEGVLTSASLVTTTAGFRAACTAASQNPRLGIGLHFTLSAGQPASRLPRSSRLTDASGYLTASFGSLLAGSRIGNSSSFLDQVAGELDAQVCKAKEMGIELDHLNGERHVHLIPGISQLVFDSATQHDISHVRLCSPDLGFQYADITDLPGWFANGGLLKFFILHRLSKIAAHKMPPQFNASRGNYLTVLHTGKMHKVLHRIFDSPPAGLTEIAVHPGEPTRHSGSIPGNSNLMAYLGHRDRRREMDAVIEMAQYNSAARLVTFAEAAQTIKGTE